MIHIPMQARFGPTFRLIRIVIHCFMYSVFYATNTGIVMDFDIDSHTHPHPKLCWYKIFTLFHLQNWNPQSELQILHTWSKCHTLDYSSGHQGLHFVVVHRYLQHLTILYWSCNTTIFHIQQNGEHPRKTMAYTVVNTIINVSIDLIILLLDDVTLVNKSIM